MPYRIYTDIDAPGVPIPAIDSATILALQTIGDAEALVMDFDNLGNAVDADEELPAFTITVCRYETATADGADAYGDTRLGIGNGAVGNRIHDTTTD